MSSITNLSNSGYYQLSNPSAGNNTAPTNSTNALLQALNGQSQSAGNNNAYLLDLSPQAQQYLNASNATSSVSNPASGGDQFVLTHKQQEAITAILAKYKDAPYNQDTFNKIQNDLTQAGLGTSQLAQKDKVQNFNPTAVLVDDLNGNYAAADALSSSTNSGEQTKSTNFIQQIISQWKTLSSHSSASDNTAAASVTPVSNSAGA